MADEFVLVAKPLRIHHAVVVEHDNAFQGAAAGEAVAVQIFDILEEAEGAGVGDAGECFRGDFHAEAFPANGRMGKVDGAVHAEPGIGERADILVAVTQLQRAADAHHLAGRGQLTDAGFGEQLQKRRSGTVHNRDFTAFDADDQVVDAKAKHGSQQVFHRGDGGPVRAESGGEHRRGDGFGGGTHAADAIRGMDVKDDARVGRSGTKGKVHLVAAVQANAGTSNDALNSSLVHGIPPL